MEKSTMELENELTRAKNTQQLKDFNKTNHHELSPDPLKYLFATARATSYLLSALSINSFTFGFDNIISS